MDTNQTMVNPFLDLPSRPMRVKVLYTFDDANKTNCLARFPSILNVQTIPIDDTTQIGVIELKTCIQAIVAASPELVSRLSQADFTIYAYDYSEYETPLVGQGMLSSLLAANSPTPLAPAHQSKTMITGRVCKNVMGIFSNGVQETLEVKLRLVPVPTAVQNEYVRSMETYRASHSTSATGFDLHAWSDACHANSPAPMHDEPDDINDLPAIHRQNSVQSRRMSAASYGANSRSRQGGSGSRCNTRPSSRASVRSERPSRQPDMSYDMDSVDHDNIGHARKWAKITQTEWRGKSNLGGQDDSLRVTASTAASIRMHKPAATRPSLVATRSLEPPPRAPTPGAFGRAKSTQSLDRVPAFNRQESSLFQTQVADSLYEGNSDALVSSPERGAADLTGHTPFDFPSSPPAMPSGSSPRLPLPFKGMDSGYMSGSTCDLQADDDTLMPETDDLPVPTDNPAVPRRLSCRSALSIIEVTPGPPELLPTTMQPRSSLPQQSKPCTRQPERAQDAIAMQRRSSMCPSRPQNPQLNSTDCVATQASAVAPVESNMGQQTLAFPKAPPQSQVTGSRAASPACGTAATKLPRSGAGAKRKKVIEDKLMQSIASGTMPMYCGNCGAIETPTWRSLHCKTIEGSPDDMSAADKEGETMGVEIVDRDATGKITKYRIIKSMRKSRDRVEMQGYETMPVCNPCGLWFNKFKHMRPPDKWVKQAQKKPRKQGRKDDLQSDAVEPYSDVNGLEMHSEAWIDRPPQQSVNAESMIHAQRPRANSLQPQHSAVETGQKWTATQLDAALNRAIQSSPGRAGTQDSPIELEEDLTPKPTRRLLFTSPAKGSEVADLGAMTAKPVEMQAFTALDNDLLASKGQVGDKENVEPFTCEAADFAKLFEASPSALQSIFKTPSKFTSSTKRTPASRCLPYFDTLPLTTPSPLRRSISGSSARGKLTMNSKATPSGMNFDAFLPTFSSAERDNLFPRTPSRTAQVSLVSPSHAQCDNMTPFTKHLTQLLSKSDNHASGDFVLDMDGGGIDAYMGAFSSPGKAFDFGDMPSFLSPMTTEPEASHVGTVADTTAMGHTTGLGLDGVGF